MLGLEYSSHIPDWSAPKRSLKRTRRPLFQAFISTRVDSINQSINQSTVNHTWRSPYWLPLRVWWLSFGCNSRHWYAPLNFQPPRNASLHPLVVVCTSCWFSTSSAFLLRLAPSHRDMVQSTYRSHAPIDYIPHRFVRLPDCWTNWTDCHHSWPRQTIQSLPRQEGAGNTNMNHCKDRTRWRNIITSMILIGVALLPLVSGYLPPTNNPGWEKLSKYNTRSETENKIRSKKLKVWTLPIPYDFYCSYECVDFLRVGAAFMKKNHQDPEIRYLPSGIQYKVR